MPRNVLLAPLLHVMARVVVVLSCCAMCRVATFQATCDVRGGPPDRQLDPVVSAAATRSEVHEVSRADRAILRCRRARRPRVRTSERELGGGRAATRADVWRSARQVPGAAVERAARRGEAALRGGGRRRRRCESGDVRGAAG